MVYKEKTTRVDIKGKSLHDTSGPRSDASSYHHLTTVLLGFLVDLVLRRLFGIAHHCRDTLERRFGITLHGLPVNLVRNAL